MNLKKYITKLIQLKFNVSWIVSQNESTVQFIEWFNF
jgi:hypothetical protein